MKFLVLVILLSIQLVSSLTELDSTADTDFFDQNYVDGVKAPEEYLDPESESSSSILSRKSRSLLAVGSGRRRLSKGKDKGDRKHLITDPKNDCVYLYTEKIAGRIDTYIEVNDTSRKGEKILEKGKSINITIIPDRSKNVKSVTISCPDLKEPKSKAIMEISFNNDPNVDLKLVIDVYRGRYWELNRESKIKVWGSEMTHDLTIRNPEEVTSGTHFSYSCQSLNLRSLKPHLSGSLKTKSDGSFKPQLNGSNAEIHLTFSRFQFQPYSTFKRNGKQIVFYDSFDCSSWFTVPLWTGTLVVLFFTAILAMGVIALLDIKTMDRFENPKGKTIAIAATAD